MLKQFIKSIFTQQPQYKIFSGNKNNNTDDDDRNKPYYDE